MPPSKKTQESQESNQSLPKQSTKNVSKSTSDMKLFNVNSAKLMKVFEKMTKSIDAMTKVQEEFNANYEALSSFKDEELNELDYQLKLKNEECYNHLQDLTKTYNEKCYNLETEYKQKDYNLTQLHKQRLDELEREYETKNVEKAMKLLEDNDYSVVSIRVYKQLKDELEEQKATRAEFEKNITAEMHKELNARLKTQELQHQVNTSEMKAKIDNQTREISTLMETIESLKAEIQAQRELTREVAQAGQKSVTQNFAK